MPLSAGARFGPYEIIAQLGVGGMGEVYRAHDAKLKRDVALKFLLPAMANEPDRLARFSREAQLLASLNHPNIAHIHGIEDSTGVPALVMELVEGETLADRIARGPIDPDEAVAIARQIADALEAAHDTGVVHRDLKPANIKVRPDGRVKVLDFGLAKMFEAATDSAAAGFNPATSPTMTSPAMTREGMIMGTAAYMSPEQARGRPVDRRTDIWAFGCVLFEMLTGRRTFESGETISDAVAAILKSDPDWTAIPANTPPYIHKLLARCLQKDPQKRLPHIGLARLEIDDGPADAQGASAPVAATLRRWPRAVALGAVAIVAGGLGLAAGWYVTRPAPSPTVRFPIVLGSEQFTGQGRRLVAISPDGSQIAYAADRSLYRRALSNLESKRIVDSDDKVGAVINPAFSPDGRSIAYVSVRDLRLQRVSVDGGRHAVRVPDGIDPADAAPLTCAGVTTYKAVKVSGADSSGLVAVFGAGGLGHLAIQYARITGASVVAVDVNPDRLEAARALGAEHLVHAGEEDPVAAIQRLGGAQASISTAATPTAFEQAFRSLRRGGTLVCVGLPADNEMRIPIFETVLGGLTIKGSIVGTHHDLEEVFELHRRGLTEVYRSETRSTTSTRRSSGCSTGPPRRRARCSGSRRADDARGARGDGERDGVAR